MLDSTSFQPLPAISSSAAYGLPMTEFTPIFRASSTYWSVS
ncbi:hypothetical protein [Streptomyces sp. SID8111]|nr:hypothetical protein [Streptomyces sp. SID8111]